jgi:helix-turn-helix protein
MERAIPVLDAEFYELTQEVGGAIFGAMLAAQARLGTPPEPPPPLLQVRRGLAEAPAWYLIQAAEFAPAPLTVAGLRVRDTYASERIVAALLELMASEQWFDRSAAAEYHLMPAGRAVLGQLRERQHRLIAAIEPPPDAQAGRLAALLGRVIATGLAGADPPGVWCLALSRNRAPAADAPPLVQIFQYVEDLNAFRDDAHMAAWRSHGVSGHTWETFAFVYAGQANTADALFDQLAYRGYSRAEYAATLKGLAGRGWIERAGAAGAYRATAAGQAVRAEAERLTNSYFYGPWSSLAEGERADAHTLMLRLRDCLNQMHTS